MRAIILATGALALVVTCDSIFDGKGNSWKHPRADISSLSQTNSVVSSSQTYSTTGKAESLTSDTVENAAISTSTTSTKTDAKVKSTTVGSTKTTPTIATATATTSSKSSHSDALPIKIHITPALGVAGVILILTGIWHTLVGIKNKPIQTFLSTTYLVGMSVTVLIIYVMSPPISDAVQGAFLVAACLSGILFGLGSLLFREVAEALGCVLGGFTLSMWLLVLRPGGLITSKAGKSGFIAGFCIGVFAIYCSISPIRRLVHRVRSKGDTHGPSMAKGNLQWITEYLIIGSTAFSGSTAVVIGIDCFSRAGLKEFWLYIWDLNNNIFPLNTNTFPITRGITVEIVLIIIFFFVGIMSQIRFWRGIKERVKARQLQRYEEDHAKEDEEANYGKLVESRVAREKERWEVTYGDRDGSTQQLACSPTASPSTVGGNPKKATTAAEMKEVLNTETPDIEMDQLDISTIESCPRSRDSQRSEIGTVPSQLASREVQIWSPTEDLLRPGMATGQRLSSSQESRVSTQTKSSAVSGRTSQTSMDEDNGVGSVQASTYSSELMDLPAATTVAEEEPQLEHERPDSSSNVVLLNSEDEYDTRHDRLSKKSTDRRQSQVIDGLGFLAEQFEDHGSSVVAFANTDPDLEKLPPYENSERGELDSGLPGSYPTSEASEQTRDSVHSLVRPTSRQSDASPPLCPITKDCLPTNPVSQVTNKYWTDAWVKKLELAENPENFETDFEADEPDEPSVQVTRRTSTALVSPQKRQESATNRQSNPRALFDRRQSHNSVLSHRLSTSSSRASLDREGHRNNTLAKLSQSQINPDSRRSSYQLQPGRLSQGSSTLGTPAIPTDSARNSTSGFPARSSTPMINRSNLAVSPIKEERAEEIYTDPSISTPSMTRLSQREGKVGRKRPSLVQSRGQMETPYGKTRPLSGERESYPAALNEYTARKELETVDGGDGDNLTLSERRRRLHKQKQQGRERWHAQDQLHQHQPLQRQNSTPIPSAPPPRPHHSASQQYLRQQEWPHEPYDPHIPTRNNVFNPTRQSALLTSFRSSMAQDQANLQQATTYVDARRQEMLFEREYKGRAEAQKQFMSEQLKQQRESRMGTWDMQQAHREHMSRIQAKARNHAS